MVEDVWVVIEVVLLEDLFKLELLHQLLESQITRNWTKQAQKVDH
jgi:hypothetical protein